MLALLVLAILVGGILQRVSGMGFGLVAGPFIVLLVGPLEGVLFVNLAGAIASVLILGRVVRLVEWRRYAWLAATSVAVTVPAALLLRDASSAALEVTVGAVVVAAMTLAVVTTRLRKEGVHPLGPDARWPPVAVYAVLSGWDPRGFAATAQPFFATNALAALVAKLSLTDASFPPFSGWEWATVLGSIVAGLVVGDVLAPRVSAAAMRRGLIVLAYVGGFATLGQGLAHL
ncbi:hypothetical protein L600_004000000110 [Isoptericola variabilis J7]|uniref:TSUP family transporter n=1 Tax=Isoptericola variabilis TaxID=139208 RepID=UPI0011A5CB62|nr:TSUP family transporter [Isoptericola variabilis]TWH28366.1 hypothetical protein L600_004000000110 [Isoptericola variabilis J7]